MKLIKQWRSIVRGVARIDASTPRVQEQTRSEFDGRFTTLTNLHTIIHLTSSTAAND